MIKVEENKENYSVQVEGKGSNVLMELSYLIAGLNEKFPEEFILASVKMGLRASKEEKEED